MKKFEVEALILTNSLLWENIWSDFNAEIFTAENIIQCVTDLANIVLLNTPRRNEFIIVIGVYEMLRIKSIHESYKIRSIVYRV